jgi:hypothetical protein
MDLTPDEELLIHYGIKGMKWGLRKGSAKTGISRSRGALIDRNDRQIRRIRDARRGKGRLLDRLELKLDQLALGKERSKISMEYKIKDMKAQNARLKSGKATVNDKLEIFATTTPINLLLSNRPK